MSTRSALQYTAALSGCILALGACAYRDINPEAAAADERADGSLDALRSVKPGTAKLVFRARGSGQPAQFSVSADGTACQGFEPIGGVAHSGRGVVYPWIARMSERTRGAVLNHQPYREGDVAATGQSIQVRGTGHWQAGDRLLTRTGTCGALVTRFTPKPGHAYLVEFVWTDQVKLTCTQRVMDATDPEAMTPVPVEQIDGCSAS